MRVLVCGGREYRDFARVVHEIVALHPSEIIHGGCRGTDSLAEKCAAKIGIPQEVYKAEWQLYGRSAGPKRNQRMIDEGKPDLVLAFPGGRGTADLVLRARNAGITVKEIK